LRDDFDREIVFDVVVEEEKTKRRQNNTNSIMVYKHPYKLELGMHSYSHLAQKQYWKFLIKYFPTCFIYAKLHDYFSLARSSYCIRVLMFFYLTQAKNTGLSTIFGFITLLNYFGLQ
jgi:hypothetical protein